MLRKYEKCWESMLKAEKVCQSTGKFAKVCKSTQKYAKVCKSMQKYVKAWESARKCGKVCFMLRRCVLIPNKRLFDSTLIVNPGSKFRGWGGVKASPSTACCCQKGQCNGITGSTSRKKIGQQNVINGNTPSTSSRDPSVLRHPGWSRAVFLNHRDASKYRELKYFWNFKIYYITLK